MKTVMIFICGALLGAFAVINLWQPKLDNRSSEKEPKKIKRFNRDFDTKALDLNARDSLDDDLEDMQKEMEKVLKDGSSIFKMMEKTMLDSSIGDIGTDIGSIVEKITNDSVILEMNISNIDNSSLKIDVKDGVVSISGEARIEKVDKSRGASSRRVMVTSFRKTHPIPKGVRASGLIIETKDENTLQLIFPKI